MALSKLVSRILFLNNHLSSGIAGGIMQPPNLALHSGKDLGVSLLGFKGINLLRDPKTFGFKRPVRTSRITPDGDYPLPFLTDSIEGPSNKCSTFLLC